MNPGTTFLQNHAFIDAADPVLNAAASEGNYTIDDDNLPAPENDPNRVAVSQPVTNTAIYNNESQYKHTPRGLYNAYNSVPDNVRTCLNMLFSFCRT